MPVCRRLLLWSIVSALLPLSIVFGQSPSENDPYTAPTNTEKASVFAHRIIAPHSLAKSALMAGINQWQHSPEEWGQGLEGYLQRYGHKLAIRGFENVIGLAVAIPWNEDPRYFYSGEAGIWPRSRHALKMTILSHNDSKRHRVAFWRLAGNYGSQFVSNTWRPARQTDVSDTLFRGTVSLAYDAGLSVFKEFWPDIRRRIFRRH
jgi:hypothetical protein